MSNQFKIESTNSNGGATDIGTMFVGEIIPKGVENDNGEVNERAYYLLSVVEYVIDTGMMRTEYELRDMTKPYKTWGANAIASNMRSLAYAMLEHTYDDSVAQELHREFAEEVLRTRPIGQSPKRWDLDVLDIAVWTGKPVPQHTIVSNPKGWYLRNGVSLLTPRKQVSNV